MAAKNFTLTVRAVRELLDYYPDTGIFVWRYPRSRTIAGSVAGTIKNGYVCIKVLGVNYAAHRLAWLHYYGHYPVDSIDHIDRDKQNNRIHNLRDIPHRINTQNRAVARVDNKSTGILGVTLEKSSGRFMAQITSNGKSHKLGRFATAAEARAAYIRAKRELHEGCTI